MLSLSPFLVRALALAAFVALSLAPVGAATAQQPTAAETSAPAYRLGAGDVLRISVFQNPELSLEARVSESGQVSYPLLGVIKLGEATVAQAERLIADGLRSGGFVKQPQVSILVTQVRAHQANVLGQVNRPGRFALEAPVTRLSDLLALAGGVASTGGDAVVLSGVRNGQPYRLEVDLGQLFNTPNSPLDVAVRNGDVLWVERASQIYIYGEVQRPGALRLERNMSLLQGLAGGGGLSPRGTERGIRVHRRGADGKVQVLQPAMDEALQHGDVIYVRESLF
jgi:polysaccharide biosynthesis/export protein